MDKSTERLYQAAKELKSLKNPSQVARAFNTSPQTIKNWETRGISKEGLLKAQEIIGVSAQWLETGTGNMILTTTKTNSDAVFLGYIDTWDENTPLIKGEVKVPFYEDIKLSADKGFADDINHRNNRQFRFSSELLNRSNIKSENVVCVKAIGDSMSPMFSDGAILGIDMGAKNIRDGKIYAFNHKGLFRTKILQLLPDRKVKIKSFNNKDYPDEEASLEDIYIIGRVFWVSELLL